VNRRPALFSIGLLLVSVACSSLVTAPKQVQPTTPSPGYLRATAEELTAVLPPFPAPGSLEAQADLEAVRQAQIWRTPEQIAWARKIDALDCFDNAEVLGPWFKPENLPRLTALVGKLRGEIYPVMSVSKKHFDRSRPPLVDPGVHPVVDLPRGSSYPSGHTLMFFSEALVLGEIFPDRREALLERAHRAAWGRIFGGVHFPSDLVAGRLLAEALFADLMKNEEFRAELERCRQEAARFLLAEAG
jgi:acid phosphatase (class A)